MVARRAPDGGFELELALRMSDARAAIPELAERLAEAGAGRVDELRVGLPRAGKRDVKVLTDLTLAVGGVANLVAIVNTVYKWLGDRKAREAEKLTPTPGEVPTVTITSGTDTVTLTYPSDRMQERAVELFLRAHGQGNPES